MRSATTAGPVTTYAVWQSASRNVRKIRRATGTHADASGRAGRITSVRWNIVDQSSSVLVTPFRLVSFSDGSGFFATAERYSAAIMCAYGRPSRRHQDE